MNRALWMTMIATMAEGSAARVVLQAKAYLEQTVADAKGQTSRFNQMHEQYKNAPAVTRERLYLEAMERVLGTPANCSSDSPKFCRFSDRARD